MRAPILASLLFLALPEPRLEAARAPQAQGPDVASFLNERLRHSAFTRIESGGMIHLRTPDRTHRFDIREASFNVNDRNGDHRLRIVAGSGEDREGVRESFVCNSAREAREAVEALRSLRKAFTDREERFKPLRTRLETKDAELPFTTVGEAIDFVNDRLAISVVTGIDAQGHLFINTTDTTYRADLKASEFMLNRASDDPKVRIYGPWSLATWHWGRLDREQARESFTTVSRRAAYQVIKTLYLLKGVHTGMGADRVATLPNVTRQVPETYSTVAGAVEALNEHLAISQVLGVDDKGVATINTSENIYRIDLGRCTVEPARPRRGTFEGWFRRTFHVGHEEGVTLSARDGLRRYTSPDSYHTVDEETFSCESAHDTREVLRALAFIQERLRSGKG